jgi:hypothetical protein
MGKHAHHRKRLILSGLCAFYALSILACSPDMSDQPKYRPLRESDFFSDGRSIRPALEGTVARGQMRINNPFYTGRENGVLLDKIPVPLTRELLEHGQERFNIFCTPCHGYVGDGTGMVVQRGFQKPSSYHIDRLREMPDGYFFDVITHGQGAMASYASRIPPRDRWAITAYIRALQLSQGAIMDDVPAEERQRLMNTKK